MLSWIGWLYRFVKRLLSGRRVGFSDKERGIFRYWNGSAFVVADPFEVQRLLEKHGGRNWMQLMSGLGLGGGIDVSKLSPAVRESMAAVYSNSITKLSDLVRLAFHVGPLRMLDGKVVGLVDSECLTLLADFFSFLTDLETEFRPLLLPPIVEDSEPSAEELTTEPLSESQWDGTDLDGSEPKTLQEASQ